MGVVEDLLCGDNASGWFHAFSILVVVIGLYVLLRFVIRNLYACATLCCCRCKQDLRKKYAKEGEESYAVVTGGSEGIGLELCSQLAD